MISKSVKVVPKNMVAKGKDVVSKDSGVVAKGVKWLLGT